MSTTRNPLTFHYQFDFKDGNSRPFDIHLDSETLEILDRPAGPLPEWTKLDNHRCANCPLAGKAQYCPVAINMSRVVEAFKDSVSYDEAVVTVTTGERTYQKATSLQRAISSIIGIYNVTSNCPILRSRRNTSDFARK